MAQLALSVAGAAIGSAFGMPQLGWLVGSLLGSLLFGPKAPSTTIEGPRLGDLTVQSSTYGTPLPYGYGTVRIAGNVIWSPGIVEHKTTTTQRSGGGKGGGKKASQTSITYTYSCSFAVGLAEGTAVAVLRIWADSKLIYDTGTGTTPYTKLEGLNFRFYPGDETQVPDSLMETDKGVGNVPAHRGLAYIVFDDLPLANFANRIPNISVEIVFKQATQQFPTLVWTPIEDPTAGRITSTTGFTIDWQRDVVYMTKVTGLLATKAIRRMQYTSMHEDRVVLEPNILTDSVTDFAVDNLFCGKDGYLYGNGDGGNCKKIIRIDPNSFKEIQHFGSTSVSTSNSIVRFVACTTFGMLSAMGPNGRIDFLLCGGFFNQVGVINAATMTYVWGAAMEADESRQLGFIEGDIFEGEGTAYFVAGGLQSGAGESANIGIYKFTIQAVAAYDALAAATSGVVYEKVATLSASSIIPGASLFYNCVLIGKDPSDGGIIIGVNDASGLNPLAPRMIKWTEADGVVWNTLVPDYYNATNSSVPHNTRLDGSTYSWISGAGSAVRTIDLRTGVYTNDDSWVGLSSGYPQVYDSHSNSILFRNGSDGGPTGSAYWKKIFLGRSSASGDVLSSIVSDMCQRAGLAESDIDVSDLTDTVPGYIVGQPSSIRSALEPLMQAYFFDCVESDFILKFVKRGGSLVATIPQSDMAYINNDTGEVIREARVQEVELPQRVNVLYMDSTNDYQQGTQFDKRVAAPAPTMSSRNQTNLQLALALDADTAKAIAQKWLFSSWIERVSYEASLSWSWLLLDPADIVDLVLDSGTTFHSRIIKSDVGADLNISMNLLAQDGASYTADVTADKGSGLPQQTIAGTGFTRLFMLDLPLLRDIDDTSGVSSRAYYMMGGFGQSGWPGALLYRSADNVSFQEAGQTIAEVSYGSCVNALGAPVSPFATDEINTLTVYMTTGSEGLASITQLEMLNGGNPAVIIASDGTPEVIQFRDVTPNDDGSFTLAGLLRGRRGTDVYATAHSSGDTFILLEVEATEAILLSLSELNLTRFYKGVGFGTLFEDADLETRTNTGRDLKPWAPVHFKATTVSSDLALTWERRSRINGGLADGVGLVPLGETTESYEIDILSGPGGSLKRTLTSSTTGVTYLAANITTDFGSIPATLTARVYQMSSAVGRGFSYEFTVGTA